MASNLNGESMVYVHADNSYLPDRNLPSPNLISIVFNVIRKYHCNTDNTNTLTDHNTLHEFQYAFDQFGSASSHESDALVSNMLYSVGIPFPLENLYRLISLNASFMTPLNSINDMVGIISHVARQLVGAAGRSNRTSISMRVTIENQVIVPLRFMESLRRSREQEEEELSLESGQGMNMVRETSRLSRRTEFAAAARLRVASTEEAVMIRVAPAAKACVETLEKFTYEGVSEVMTCPICMEEVSSGTQLTRMPCSHLFHGHCVVKWLERRHTCPLCRFELPTSG